MTFKHRDLFIFLLPILLVLYGTFKVRLGLYTVRFPMGLRAIQWPATHFRFRRMVQILLRVAVSVALVAALAEPQATKVSLNREASGVNMILALDKSAVGLGNARTAVGRFIESRKNDRIGLIEFSSQANVISPPTLDHRFLAQGVESIQRSGTGGGGALGEVVAQAVKQLRDSPTPSRSLVVLVGSKGGTGGGSIPTEAAVSLAQAYGMKVNVIAVDDTSATAAASALTSVSVSTGGTFSQGADVDAIEQAFGKILSTEFISPAGNKILMHEELFALPLLVGLAALLLEFWMSKTWMRKWPN